MSSMLPLVIGPEERAALKQIAAAAAADPVPLEVVQGLTTGELMPEAVNQGKKLTIPMGFVVVLTHEHQVGGVLRHLSVSIDLPGRVPHPEAVRMIMEEIGFVLPLEKCFWWEEACGPGRVAINVVEPVDGDWSPHRTKVSA